MSVLWRADATKGVEQEWASYSTGAHCGTTTYAGLTDPNLFQFTDATAPHGRAYRSQLSSADNGTPGCYSTGHRNEINMGNSSKNFSDGVDRTFHEGQDRWISMMIKLDANYPTYASGFPGCSIVQLTHPAGNDGGLFNLQCSYTPTAMHDKWGIWGYSTIGPGNSGRYDHPLGDILSCRGKWVSFTFHILFTTANSGFAEVYSDMANPGGFSTIPLLWARTGLPTIKSGRAYAFMTFGFYGPPSPLPTMKADLAGLTCGTDRASVEASAFGTYIPPSVNPPVPAFTTSPSPATAGAQVTFDASASTGVAPLSYAWVDGATGLGSLKVQPFTFQIIGTKHPTLTVTDVNGSASVEHDLIVNASNPTPPVAAFTISPSPATVGQTVTLNGSASTGTAPLTYAWTDGATSLGTLQTQTYAFASAGTHHLTLTARDANGTTASVTHDLVVSGVAPPVASFTTSPSPAQTGQVVTFDASASTGTAPLSYAWTDANGGNSLGNLKVQPFTFRGTGTKLVTLVVTDGAGMTSTVEHDLVITLAPVTPFPRADLQSPPILTVGGDYFIKVVTRLPSNLPTAGLTAMRFASIDGPPAAANAPLALGVTVSSAAIHWCLQRGSDYSNDIVWTGPVVDNAWHKFILHVNLAVDATGYVELWMDGARQTFTSLAQTLNMITYGSDNNGGPNWLDIQSYRNSGWLAAYTQGAAQGGSATPGTLTVHHAPPMIAPTFAAVDTRGAGTTHYVDNGGSDAADGLTAATAWKTVDKVNRQTFQPGDKVLFTGGQTFPDATLECFSSGTAGNPVTFGVSGAGRASFPLGIYLKNYNYVIFDSLSVATSAAIPFNGDGNNITVNNCVLDGLSNTTTGGSVTLGLSAKGNNWTVTNNVVQNCGLSGIQWYGDTFLATGNTITNVGLRSTGSPNPAVGYNAHGLYLGQSGFPGRNTTCTANTIYNPAALAAMMESGISQRSNNGTYTGNTIHHAAVGIDFYESDPVGGGSSTWSGNTIHDTTAAAMFVQGPTGGDYPTSESFTIQNNTIGPPISGVGINVQASYTTGTVTF